MLLKNLAVVATAVGTAVAQRPSNTSICDYYTTALLKNNTAANQKTLLTLVVNTAVIGNCKLPSLLLLSLPTLYRSYEIANHKLCRHAAKRRHQRRRYPCPGDIQRHRCQPCPLLRRWICLE